MGNHNKWIKLFFLVAGIVEIASGIAHFFMPYFAYQAKGFSFLQRDETGFVTLCVLAVGILLIAFGALTIFFSLNTKTAQGILLYYAIIKSLLWLARIILEILYPVKIPLFFIEQPTMVIMPLLIFEWLLFVIPAVLITISRKQMSNELNAAGAKSRAAN